MHLLSDGEIARLRQRWTDPEFAAAQAPLRAGAGAAVADRRAIPAQGAGWFHDYFCPEHSNQLTYDPDQPARHVCPVDGRVFTGEPFDAAWRVETQTRITHGLYCAALAWLATGQPHYAERAIDILERYAERYPGYAPHGEHAGQGRCFGQSLDEAVWSIRIAWAYDAVREALTSEQRARITRDLLRPLGEHLLGQLWHKPHNIECWHLAGLATLGAALDEPRFVAPALDEPFGFAGQLRAGVLADGWWLEGSPPYHFYMLTATLAIVVALRRRVPAVLDLPQFRAMLRAPLAIARADLSLPALNDGWFDIAAPNGLGAHAASYERAWALWGDPAYPAALRRFYAAGATRSSTDALLFGPDLTGDESLGSTPARSLVQEASGYAVLRQEHPPGNHWLLLKYGPHGGGHGHPDKLHLDLHAFGTRLAADPGSPGYSVPLHGVWFRHTLAHNTILLSEERQPEATGRLLRFVAPENAPFGVIDAAVSWPLAAPAIDRGGAWIREERVTHAPAYAGVTARRCILWKPGRQPYFLDIVLVDCPDARPIDLAWHHLGALVDPDPATLAPCAWSPAGAAYAQLRDTRLLTGQYWRSTWQAGAIGTRCWALDPPGATALAARAPYNPTSETRALLLRRVTARRAAFVALYELFANEPTIRDVHWGTADLASDGRCALVVDRGHHHDHWHITDTGTALIGADREPTDAPLYYRLAPQSEV